MSEAPERIWVSERPTNHSLGACHVYKLSHADEYVRADRIAALEADLLATCKREAATQERHDAKMTALEAERDALAAQLAEARDTLQRRVWPWMLACFGEEIANDREERGDRLLEEVFELLQSGGYDPARVLLLRNYVWSRDVGEPSQEVGGVMITLAAYCLAHGLDMHEAGETELARIWTKVEAIRAKQAAKPKGSALPIDATLAKLEAKT